MSREITTTGIGPPGAIKGTAMGRLMGITTITDIIITDTDMIVDMGTMAAATMIEDGGTMIGIVTAEMTGVGIQIGEATGDGIRIGEMIGVVIVDVVTTTEGETAGVVKVAFKKLCLSRTLPLGFARGKLCPSWAESGFVPHPISAQEPQGYGDTLRTVKDIQS